MVSPTEPRVRPELLTTGICTHDCACMCTSVCLQGPGEYDLSALSMSASVDRSGLHSRGTSGMASTSKRAEMAMPVLYEQNIFGDDSVRLFDSPSAVNQSNPNPATVDLHRVNQRKPVSRKGL